MTRERIGVDADDVLFRSAEGFAAFSNLQWGEGHRAEDYTEEWAVFWGVPLDEAKRRADEVHRLEVFGKYLPFYEATPVLGNLALKRDLSVVTSRRSSVAPVTATSIERHFPGLFQGIHHVGIWDSDDVISSQLARTKTELCLELGVDYLIDDQLKHCFAAAEVGIQALLFGDYRWNQANELPEGVVRVANWQEVDAYFEGMK